ncbi:MAG: type III-B CRISPR module RAMP protein Cmr6 [Candidatus Lokiarchaeota archaeon]|nr:type III-B CRISPR module RAMP protein Cmr6 [Candidatus Lokiarchaeota archaeon]
MIKKGKLVIKDVRKGKIYLVQLISKKGKQYTKPIYFHTFPDSMNGKDCEVGIEGDRIVSIIIDGEKFTHQQAGSNNMQIKQVEIHDSFDVSKTILPNDTKHVLNFINDIDNFSLKLNKAARFEEHEKDASKSKFEFFKNKKYQIIPNFGNNEFDKISKDYKSNIANLLMIFESLQINSYWRLIIGLGNESVYETGITLHHIYGFPYIPGSAIKGILRNWIIEKEFNKLEGNKSEGAYHDEGFCRIFGSPKDSVLGEHVGSLHFFDAYPISEPDVESDVMNPHYSKYYADKTNKIAPADYHDPKPIFFLTVKNASFEFIFGIKGKDDKPVQGEKIKGNPLELVQEWLPKALSEHGIGAKTAVGYGYMG